MKKVILLFTLLTAFISAFAQNPAIPLAQAFDGRYNNSKGVKIYESRQENNYYYSIKVNDNPEIIDQLLKWTKETESLANSVSTSINSGDYNIILTITGEQVINIGIRYPSDHSTISIFLQSNHPFL